MKSHTRKVEYHTWNYLFHGESLDSMLIPDLSLSLSLSPLSSSATFNEGIKRRDEEAAEGSKKRDLTQYSFVSFAVVITELTRSKGSSHFRHQFFR
jgi:hypothetical protein